MEPTRQFSASEPAVETLRQYIGAVVSLNGLVETVRDQKRMQFVVLNSQGGGVQLVHEKAGD